LAINVFAVSYLIFRNSSGALPALVGISLSVLGQHLLLATGLQFNSDRPRLSPRLELAVSP
jgi:hypothetical protein